MRDVKQRNNFIYFCPWVFVISHPDSRTICWKTERQTHWHMSSVIVCASDESDDDVDFKFTSRYLTQPDCSGILILIRLPVICCYYIFSHSIVCATLLITAVLNFSVYRFETRCVLLLLLCLSKHIKRKHTHTHSTHFASVCVCVCVSTR